MNAGVMLYAVAAALAATSGPVWKIDRPRDGYQPPDKKSQKNRRRRARQKGRKRSR